VLVTDPATGSSTEGASFDPAVAQAIRQYPSVSLLLPVASAGGPVRARLRTLRAVAESRLHEEFGPAVDPALLDRLHQAVEEVEVGSGAVSLALFVNADSVWSIPLGVRVRERAVIDDTFATRDLVEAATRSPRYWILALGPDRPRLFRGQGQHLEPEPLDPAGPGDLTGSGDDRRGHHGADAAAAHHHLQRLEAVDAAVGARIANDQHPLVVVGAEPMLSRYLRMTRHVARIEAPIRRDPAHDLAAVGEWVWPTVAQALADRRDDALAALDHAVRSRRAVSGPAPVWRSAQRSSGALLIVERGFEYPALVTDGTLEPTEDPTAPGVIDDAIDDIIEMVLGRGGRVEIVPDGALAAHQRVALIGPDAAPR
jgi:hypothetical protein